MNKRGTLAGIAALIVVLFSGSPVSANDSELAPKITLEDLRKEIRELKEDITLLRRSALRNSELTNNELKLMNERMARIEDALARLSPGVSTRSAASFTPAPPAATGTLRLMNTMATTATVVVDNVAYTVPPFSERSLANRPAGPITYQVSNIGGVSQAVRSVIVANERLTVWITPSE